MHSQPSLPGIDIAPIPTDNLFFAIFPETDAAVSIENFARASREKHGLNGKLLATERFHISLHHIGNFAGLPQGILAVAGKAATAAAVMPPFEIVFDRAMSFVGRPGNHPFVLCGSDGVAALTAFHQALGAAMERAGLKPRKSHYTPHITLMYGDRCIAEQVVEPVAWTVRGFALVRSIARRPYALLARWTLLSGNF
ncbi:MAG: 2'-5' RNA ligase family protein [Dechloromonas sp.]|nr:2'-5' RNA ligase family protein [Dechloromonas sp.]